MIIISGDNLRENAIRAIINITAAREVFDLSKDPKSLTRPDNETPHIFPSYNINGVTYDIESTCNHVYYNGPDTQQSRDIITEFLSEAAAIMRKDAFQKFVYRRHITHHGLISMRCTYMPLAISFEGEEIILAGGHGNTVNVRWKLTPVDCMKDSDRNLASIYLDLDGMAPNRTPTIRLVLDCGPDPTNSAKFVHGTITSDMTKKLQVCIGTWRDMTALWSCRAEDRPMPLRYLNDVIKVLPARPDLPNLANTCRHSALNFSSFVIPLPSNQYDRICYMCLLNSNCHFHYVTPIYTGNTRLVTSSDEHKKIVTQLELKMTSNPMFCYNQIVCFDLGDSYRVVVNCRVYFSARRDSDRRIIIANK